MKHFICGVYKLARMARFRGILKTIYWNIRLLPFKQAIRFPIILGGSCSLSSCRRGCIQFNSDHIKPGILIIGTEWYGLKPRGGVALRIEGKLVVNGCGLHWFGSNGYLTIAKTGCLEIGDDFTIGSGWCIYASSHSSIGSDCMFSWNILLLDTDCHPITDSVGNLLNPPQAIVIGDHVWLGAYSKILKGSYIPSGSIVASGSIVNSHLTQENSIYIGNHSVKNDIHWSKQSM